jgi:hypothetical protein
MTHTMKIKLARRRKYRDRLIGNYWHYKFVMRFWSQPHGEWFDVEETLLDIECGSAFDV